MKKFLRWLTNDKSPRGGKHQRRGVSLVEVLIGAFILAVGLAGLAGLVEVGRYSVVETYKADRSAACGRAVLHDLKTRGLISKASLTANKPLLIDPIGGVNPAGLDPITPQNMASMWTRWQDDISKPKASLLSENYVRSNPPLARGQYSWIVTINPSQAENSARRRSFEASVAVCFARSGINDQLGIQGTINGRGVAGGRITIDNGHIRIKENQWLLITGGTGTQQIARWYRVVAANSEDMGNGQVGSDAMNVMGPDWDTAAYGPNVTIHAFENVSAVYTEAMAIPADPAWNRFDPGAAGGNP